jgi:hypothetical protein
MAGVDDAELSGVAAQASLTANSLTANSLTANSLTANSLTANSLTTNSLTADSLMANSLTASALEDPAARSVLKYIVGCALPAGAEIAITVDGTDYQYEGQLGIAPQWGQDGGQCDDVCVAAVSSCVLGRLNYLGEVVALSMRGAAPLATSPDEMSAYPNVDGVYFGNVFTSPQIRLACLPPGVTELTRVCGPSLTDCVVTSVGQCTDVCEGTRSDDSFTTCGDQPPGADGVTMYDSPVTVFLQ